MIKGNEEKSFYDMEESMDEVKPNQSPNVILNVANMDLSLQIG